LSGGGYRGLYAAEVLANFESTSPSRPIYERFDLFAGTSIGGILAIGLAMERPAIQIRDAILRHGASIFPNRDGMRGWPGRAKRSLRSIFTSRYATDALRLAVEEIVGTEATLADLRRPLLVPAVAITAGAPQLFHSAHRGNRSDLERITLVDVALATAAAPIYFPIAQIGANQYVDGGIIANAPDLAAVLEAECHLAPSLSGIHVMSVGTTSAEAAFASRPRTQRGLVGWIRRNRLLEVTMAAQQEHVIQLCEGLLGERYFRINATQTADQADVLALDSATLTATKTLQSMATTSTGDARNDPRLHQFLNHEGQPLR
jgi:patatin-like phospholipase/acyl hydrolase